MYHSLMCFFYCDEFENYKTNILLLDEINNRNTITILRFINF